MRIKHLLVVITTLLSPLLTLSTPALITQTVNDNASVTINGTGDSMLGYQVHTLNPDVGDLNGSLLISAPFTDGDNTNSGSAYVFDFPFSSNNLNESNASIPINGSIENAKIGSFVATNGDIDGDGKTDFVLLNPAENKIQFYLGKDKATWNTAASFTLIQPNLTTDDNTNRYLASSSCSISGDLNGDGIDDIVIGYTNNSGDTNPNGSVHIIFGKTSFENGPLADRDDIKLTGSSAGENAGYSVEIIPDINNDGYDELLVGTYNESAHTGTKTYLIYGSNNNLNSLTNGEDSLSLASANAIFHSKSSGSDGFGESVIGLGDINGDDYNDFAITAPNTDTEKGAIYLYYGGPNKPYQGNYTDPVSPAYSAKITSSNSYYLGLHAVKGQMDLNGDGTHDIAIGSFLANSDNGEVFIVTNNNTLSGNTDLDSITSIKLLPSTDDQQLGFSLASVRDTNHDGIDELLVGSKDATNGIAALFRVNTMPTANPSEIESVEFFSDPSYTSTTSSIQRGQWLYIQAEEEDPSPTQRNLFELSVSSNTSTKNGRVRLIETGTATGIYKGKIFIIGTRTCDISKHQRATKDDTLTINSPYTPEFTVTLTVTNAAPVLNRVIIEQTGTKNATTVDISYNIQDYDNDNISLENKVHYSIDNGENWESATLTGTLTNASSSDLGVTHNQSFESLTWRVTDDLGNNSSDTVQLKVITHDGSTDSNEKLSNILTLDNSAPAAPQLATPNSKYSANIIITGNAEADSTVHIYVNDVYNTSTTATQSGTFSAENISVSHNDILSAIAVDSFGFKSPTSNDITITLTGSTYYYEDDNFQVTVNIPLNASSTEKVLTFTHIHPTESTPTAAPTLTDHIDTFSLFSPEKTVESFDKPLTFNIQLESALTVTNGISVLYYNPEIPTWSSTSISIIDNESTLNTLTFTAPYLAHYSIVQLIDPNIPVIDPIQINGHNISEYNYYGDSFTLSTTLSDNTGVASYNIQISADSSNAIVASENIRYIPDSDPLSIDVSLDVSDLQTDSYTINTQVWDRSNNSAQKTHFFKVSQSTFNFDILHGPNPFNPSKESLIFGYDLTVDIHTLSIIIVDQTGKKIWSTRIDNETAGYKTVSWNGKNSDQTSIPNGIYYAYCFAKKDSTVKKKRLVIAVIQ